ncbi:peptidase, partial [Capnocytophaga sputigena]|uniref:peptidase n=1 Tax=Capnocytophaga sputigena TaxID=1019 RepID=UPI0028D2108B
MPRNHLNKPLSQYTDDNFSKEEINLFESHLNSPEAQDVEKAQKEEIQSQKDKLVVIDEAKYQFGAHLATFKPLTKTPSIQGKTVGTIVETQPVNFSFADGFQLTSLGQWEKYGTIKFQNNEVILQGSVISYVGQIPGSNTVETGKAKCLQSGQKKTLEHIDTTNEAFPSYKTPPPSADCIVKFSLNENYSNLFGFDSYEISKKNCTDKEKFKNAYKKLEPFREEYLMPWVSLAQYRYIFLKLNIKGKFKEITFNDPKGYFAFEPDTLTSKDQEVKITCNNIIKEKDYKVEVLADGKVAGGLMFVENSIKKLMFPVNWYNVVVNPTDKGKIKKIVEKQKIEAFCKRAFTPALIEVEINEITTVIDISKLKNNLYNDIILIKDNSSFLLRPLFLAYLLHYAVTRNPYQISLYTTYIKNENMDKDEHHNGFTWHSKNLKYPSPEAEKIFIDKKIIPTLSLSKEAIEKNIQTNDKEEVCVMFLANDKLQTEGEIPHELMHALGLEHTFEEKNHPNKEYTFWKDLTNNYMDYNNKKEVTFKWQWDILRSSKYLKIL